MPTPTYDLIASSVLGSSAATVTFSSIPATYRDLVLVVTATASANEQIYFRPNGATTNLSSVSAEARSDGTTFSATFNNIGGIFLYNNMGSTTSTQIIQIMDYAQTDKHKTLLLRLNNASNGTSMHAGRWASTSAITSLDVVISSGTFSSASSFYLYGIVS